MPTAAELRLALGLPPGPDGAEVWTTLERAAALVPESGPELGRVAALRVLARGLADLPGGVTLLTALREAVMHPQPERQLTYLLAQLTGGHVAIHASWGDLIAASGDARPGRVWPLRHGARQVGTLTAAADPGWAALWPVAAEYALLARLQAAAAGAARRRVGERALEALLAGQEDGPGMVFPVAQGAGAGSTFAVAVARFSRAGGAGAGARLAQGQALDVLASAGEGHFMERGIPALSTVRAAQAVWLWPDPDLERDGRALHAALLASTAQDLRVGVSARHPLTPGTARPGGAVGPEVRAAFAEASQALSGVRSARRYALFQEIDPLCALLGSGALDTLRAQVQGRLARLEDAGRTEATLRAYLGHTGSLGDLAAQLNIHVNTLRYRLRRAEDALGAPLSDPRLVARLYLALEEPATA